MQSGCNITRPPSFATRRKKARIERSFFSDAEPRAREAILRGQVHEEWPRVQPADAKPAAQRAAK